MHPLKMAMSLLILIGASLYFLPCCTAQDLACTVTPEADGRTTYRIPDFNQSKCQISWTDVNNTVLARQDQQRDDNVGTTLITPTCMDIVLYKRDCISEGIVQTATCNATCNGPAGLVTENGHRTLDIVICVAVVILALAIITGVALWRKKKIRVRARDLLRGLHPYLPPCMKTAMNYTPTPGQPEDVNV